MILDTKKYELRNGIGNKNKEVYHITPKEMKILKTLKRAKRITIDELIKQTDSESETSVRVAIMRMKRKIPVLEIDSQSRTGYLLKSYIKVV